MALRTEEANRPWPLRSWSESEVKEFKTSEVASFNVITKSGG